MLLCLLVSVLIVWMRGCVRVYVFVRQCRDRGGWNKVTDCVFLSVFSSGILTSVLISQGTSEDISIESMGLPATSHSLHDPQIAKY